MFFLLSGEGPTDIGSGRTTEGICEGDNFVVGPMAIIVEQIVKPCLKYSILDGACGFVSKHHLSQRAAELKIAKKKLRLPGKKQVKETRYFFNNARVLSRIAMDIQVDRKGKVVAVLFRDSDETASAASSLWEDKRKSMLDGFTEEGFLNGVPMIPKPKSEAWLICALKKHSYQGCEALEKRSGNDKSPNSLKGELKKLLDEDITPELLCEKVRGKVVDIDRIKMPSFKAFRDRLEQVI